MPETYKSDNWKVYSTTIGDAIAESQRTGQPAQVEKPALGVELAISMAETAARSEGLEIEGLKTTEGIDLIARPKGGGPVAWHVSIIIDTADYTCSQCGGTTMAIGPFGEAIWCECASREFDDSEEPSVLEEWSNVRSRTERRLEGKTEADDGSSLWNEKQWQAVVSQIEKLKADNQW